MAPRLWGKFSFVVPLGRLERPTNGLGNRCSIHAELRGPVAQFDGCHWRRTAPKTKTLTEPRLPHPAQLALIPRAGDFLFVVVHFTKCFFNIANSSGEGKAGLGRILVLPCRSLSCPAFEGEFFRMLLNVQLVKERLVTLHTQAGEALEVGVSYAQPHHTFPRWITSSPNFCRSRSTASSTLRR